MDAPQRREMVTAVLPTGGRHHRLLVPGEDARDTLQVADARESLLQLRQRIGHRAGA
jgi:hypothetical protein